MCVPLATLRRLRSRNASGSPFACWAHGLGHEPQSLPDVRRTDARSAQIGRPNGVVLVFQVSGNHIKPPKPSFARNLLSKDDWRDALLDEPEPFRPEVTAVSKTFCLSGCGEGLAGTTSGPDLLIIRPSS